MSETRTYRRIVLDVDPAVDDRVRAEAARRGVTLKQLFLEALEAYFREHPAPARTR